MLNLGLPASIEAGTRTDRYISASRESRCSSFCSGRAFIITFRMAMAIGPELLPQNLASSMLMFLTLIPGPTRISK